MLKKENKEIKEGKLEEKIIDLQLNNNLKTSNLHLQHLYSKIRFYQKQLEIHKDNKPFSFQKKKLQEYNQETEEYEQKIKEIYKQINEEMNLISEVKQNIN